MNREPEIRVISQAEEGQLAIALFREHWPDVMPMDLRMLEVTSVEAIAVICAELRQARTVVLSINGTR